MAACLKFTLSDEHQSVAEAHHSFLHHLLTGRSWTLVLDYYKWDFPLWVCMWSKFSFLWDKCPGVQLNDHVVNICSVLPFVF